MNAVVSFADLETTAGSDVPMFLTAQTQAAKAYSVQQHSARRYTRPYKPSNITVTNYTPPAAQQTSWGVQNADLVRKVTEMANRGSNFGKSVLSYYHRNGFMAKGQADVIRKIIAEDMQNAQKAQAATVAPVATPVAQDAIDLSAVPAGRYAVPDGDTRLKVLINKPEAGDKWAGFVFVSDAAVYGQRQKYGMQKPGRAYEGKIKEQLRAIIANPKAAMAAYGQLTGTCGMCGRKLEDEESVRIGIGPICRAKW